MLSGKTVFIIMLFALFLSMPLAQGEIKSAIEARDQVAQALLDNDLAAKRILVRPDLLPAGVSVYSWRGEEIKTPAAGYAVFVDDLPYANFEHPCRFVFVDAATGRMDVKKATTPPLNAIKWLEMETEAYTRLMAAKNVRPRRIDNPSAVQKSPRGGELYAVLMSGGASQWSNHVRYWNDLSNIYVTLTDVYGYADENIIVLCSDGLDPAVDQSNGLNSDPDLDGDGDDDIMYSCVYSNVQLVFSQLASTLTADDQLFIFTTDHGGSTSGWSVYENLWNNETLADSQFATMLDALPDCEIIITMEQCFSGGFEDNVEAPVRVFSSAAAYNEYSWAMPPDYVYDTYVFFWTAAVKGEDAYGVPCDADTNNDDLVDMHEAFLYAEANDFSDETPQYNSNPAGLGAELTLFGSGKVYTVPGDFSTIQAAINAVEEKDTIRVAPGTYVENLDFMGKEITLESQSGPEVTVLDGKGMGMVVTFDSGETNNSVLRGFTLTNGGPGSGVYCNGSAPTIVDNIITQCVSGAYCVQSAPLLLSCLFTENAGVTGGAVYCEQSTVTVRNCTMSDNGAVIQGGAIYCGAGSTVTMVNTVCWDNTPDEISGPGTMVVTCSDVMGGFAGDGNIDEDPLFADAAFRLSRTSPCINRGDTSALSSIEKFDLMGQDRVLNGAVDMGALEADDAVLMADGFELTPRAPGAVQFDIDFGAAYGGRIYIVAGSRSGTVPGIDLGGVVIPINWDGYTDFVLTNLNNALFVDFAGYLDGAGTAAATLNWPGNGKPALIGRVFNHAAFLFDPVNGASNPVPLTFVSND